MTHKIRSKWLTVKEVKIYCIDFSGLETDREGLKAEISAVRAVLDPLPEGRLLTSVDLHQVEIMEELVMFFKYIFMPGRNPFRKMVVLGLPRHRRWWYRAAQGLIWPRNVVFMDDFEKAKLWLVSEKF